MAVVAGLDEVDGVVAQGAGEGCGDDARGEALAEAHHLVRGLRRQDVQEVNALADALQLVQQGVHLGFHGADAGGGHDGLARGVMPLAQLRDLVAERDIARRRQPGGTDQLVRDAAQGGNDDDGRLLTGTYNLFYSEDALRCAHRRTAEFQDFHD